MSFIFTQLKDDLARRVAEAKKPAVIVILGPTASGKTALSLEVAHAFGGEIISADSRQFYRGMDIGTDKIMTADRQGVPHYMIDIVDPNERFTVSDFKRETESCIADMVPRGKVPIIAGGTGLYIRTVAENFSLPPENTPLKNELYAELSAYGKTHMYNKLKELDPQDAEMIHENNVPYVMRALEIFLTTGFPKSAQRNEPHYDFIKIGLSWPKEKLLERIDSRVEAQLKRGLVDEVKGLLAKGYSPTLPSMSSLGYREIIEFLNGARTLPEAAGDIQKNTRNYAKRQLTWFKKEPNVTWIEADTHV